MVGQQSHLYGWGLNALDDDGLDQSFPRLVSLRGCERAHVLVVRTCKHLASVHPRVQKVRPHETVDECYRDASALLRKTRQNSLTGIIRLALVLGRDMKVELCFV